MVEADPIRRTLLAVDGESGELWQFAEDSWKKVGDLGKRDDIRGCLAWDAARKVIVIAHNTDENLRYLTVAKSWNGKILADLPAPDIEWPSRRWLRGAPHPISGQAVFQGGDNGDWTLGKTAFVEYEDELLDPVSKLAKDEIIPGWQGEADVSHQLRTHQGTLWRQSPDGLEQLLLYEGKKKDPYRARCSLVWDAKNERVIMAGGLDESHGNKPARDTWEWTKKSGWREIQTKGKPIGRDFGLGVFANGELIIVDGKNPASKKAERVRVTEHFDGTRWTAYEDKFKGASRPHALSALFFDQTSGFVFAVSVDTNKVTLWEYHGGGQWRAGLVAFVDELAGVEELTFAFDATRRRLVAKGPLEDRVGTEGIFATELGPWLDSLSSKTGAIRAKEAQPKSARSAETTTTSARYLFYRESGLGKYWFANIKRTTWTARWGKRGTKGETKTFSFASPQAARVDFDKKVQSKLDKGYVDSDRGEKIAEVASRAAFLLAPSRKPTLDRLGGIAPVDPPRCKTCLQPMGFIALFTSSELLALPKPAKALAIFMCNSGERCKTWDPSSGANAAIFLDEPPKAAPKGRGVEFSKKDEIDVDAEGLDPPSPGGSKIGGYPTWVQSPQIPRCSACKSPMSFALQLEASDVGANFGDQGLGYAFTCPHGAKFSWQSS